MGEGKGGRGGREGRRSEGKWEMGNESTSGLRLIEVDVCHFLLEFGKGVITTCENMVRKGRGEGEGWKVMEGNTYPENVHTSKYLLDYTSIAPAYGTDSVVVTHEDVDRLEVFGSTKMTTLKWIPEI